MLVFLDAVAAGQPVWLCEDLRRHIHALSKVTCCRSCGVVVSTGSGRIRMCFVRDGVLCFSCWHRLRWPG